jgi:hypothetical protein
MFKILVNMSLDMLPFLSIWGIVLFMFATIGLLIFGQLDAFNDIYGILRIFFEACLGVWTMNNFKGTDYKGQPLGFLYLLGVIFMNFFLLVNMVLFLNFAVAILSSVFSFYEDKQVGLFY